DNRWATTRNGGGTPHGSPALGRFSTTTGASVLDEMWVASTPWSAKDIGLPQFSHLMGEPLWLACR
ncbi:MAG: hypothetical protein MK364_08805, partial [Pirellulales bacterium]|nr:hypothetical protein [Pirellulales bacterium]